MHTFTLDKPDNLIDWWQESEAKFAERRLFGTKNKSGVYEWVTYREVGARIHNLRAGLAQLDISQGDVVGIIANNRVEWPIVAFAAWGRIARFVPMYEAELASVWKYIIQDANVKLLFISKKAIYEKIKDALAAMPSLQKIIIMEGEGPDTLAELEKKGAGLKVKSIYPAPSAICILIYTSGTTGDPKGVLLSQANITSNAHAVTVCFPDINENDNSLSILPWAHVFGLGELIVYCLLGASMGLAESAATIPEDLALVKPTFMTAVPRVLSLIHISEPTRLLSISYAVFCLQKKKNLSPTPNNSYL